MAEVPMWRALVVKDQIEANLIRCAQLRWVDRPDWNARCVSKMTFDVQTEPVRDFFGAPTGDHKLEGELDTLVTEGFFRPYTHLANDRKTGVYVMIHARTGVEITMHYTIE